MRNRILPLAFSLAAFAAASAAQAELTCSDLHELERQFLRAHIKFDGFDSSLDERTAALYLERVDPQRLLFLESEAERQKAQLVRAARDIRNGNCAYLRKLHTEVVARTKQMEEHVRAFVTKPGYTLDPNAVVALDAAVRGWLPNEAARHKEVEALVHFQVSNLENGAPQEEVADGRARADALKRVVKRAELRTKRVNDVASEELLSAWLDAFANALDPHSVYLSATTSRTSRSGCSSRSRASASRSRRGTAYAVVEEIMPGGAAKLERTLPRGQDHRGDRGGGEPSTSSTCGCATSCA